MKKETTESKKQRIEAPVKYVKQPWPITSFAKDLTLQETHVFAELMDSISDKVSDLVLHTPESTDTGKHLYYFKDEDFDDFGMATLSLDLRNLTSRTDCYKNVQKVVEKLVAQNIRWNEATEESILEHNMNLFADVIVEKDKSNRRTGVLSLKISKYQARYFFDFARWSKYVKAIVSTCDSVYTARLYMLLSANKEYGWTVSYKKLRTILGCSYYDKDRGVQVEKYDVFKNFKFKVLDVAKSELDDEKYKDIIDFTFDYELIYATGVRPSLSNDPDKIKFIVTKTANGALIAERYEHSTEYSDLRDLMASLFSLTAGECNPIIARVHELQIREQFEVRVREIADSMQKQGDRIKQKKAYAKKSLYDALQEFEPTVIQAPEERITEISAESSVADAVSDADKATLAFVVQDNAPVWSDAFALKSVGDDAVVVVLPSKAAYETIMHSEYAGVFGAMEKEFGKKVIVEFENKL